MEIFLKRKSKSASMLGKFIFSKESDAAGLRSYRSSPPLLTRYAFIYYTSRNTHDWRFPP